MKSAADSELAAQAQKSSKGREQTSLQHYIDEELDYYREEVTNTNITYHGTVFGKSYS